MATYAIGDLQGCYDELQSLLEKIDYQAGTDRLWFVGDLINRGPKSLDCLRFVHQLGDKAVTVLGNHDLSFLATALAARPQKKQDTFADILNASDKEELVHWLRQQPLLHQDTSLGYAMVHAGLAPQWDIVQAQQCASEVETVLRSNHAIELLNNMYGDEPRTWSEKLSPYERYRFIINCFTRMRYCTLKGDIDLKTKCTPGNQAAHLVPWFKAPNRRSKSTKILFGHWSTLGITHEANTYSLDSGCVWGRCLTAMRLDSDIPEYFSIDCTVNSA